MENEFKKNKYICEYITFYFRLGVTLHGNKSLKESLSVNVTNKNPGSRIITYHASTLELSVMNLFCIVISLVDFNGAVVSTMMPDDVIFACLPVKS